MNSPVGQTFIDNENIYEVTVGVDPKNDMRFTVGKTYMKGTPNEITITDIVFDQNMLILYGVKRAIVWGETPEGEPKIWKDLIDVPMTITSKV